MLKPSTCTGTGAPHLQRLKFHLNRKLFLGFTVTREPDPGIFLYQVIELYSEACLEILSLLWDHLSWRTRYSWQKVPHFKATHPVTMFMAIGVVIQESYCINIRLKNQSGWNPVYHSNNFISLLDTQVEGPQMPFNIIITLSRSSRFLEVCQEPMALPVSLTHWPHPAFSQCNLGTVSWKY